MYEIPGAPHLCKHLELSDLNFSTNIVVVICISLITNDVWHFLCAYWPFIQLLLWRKTHFSIGLFFMLGFSCSSVVKNPPANHPCRRHRLDPCVAKIPGEGNVSPLQYSFLGNPMDRGVWQATVHGVTKSRTQLSDLTFFPTILSSVTHFSSRPQSFPTSDLPVSQLFTSGVQK